MQPLAQRVPYEQSWAAMRTFTEQRHADTPDEVWLIEHQPVYTLGQAGLASHILNAQHIPIVQCDRGGQVTYHGPGQVTVYCLWDLRRLGLYVKEYVALLEEAILHVLQGYGLSEATRKAGAPGVYVPAQAVLALQDPSTDLVKIAAIGVKIRNGRAYHGLALNVDMDLRPFQGINACGYAGLRTTDLRECGVDTTVAEVAARLQQALTHLHQQRLTPMSLPATA